MYRLIAAIAAATLTAAPLFAQSAPSSWDVPPAPPETRQRPTTNEWIPIEQAVPADPPPGAVQQQPEASTAAAPDGQTIPRRDIFDAAENLFGRGAEDLARLLERIIGDEGEPIAYIAGEEASGALVVGLRYGSGVMRHRIEGDRNVYWTGPSVGFDAGAQASKVFVLVYNLHDAQRLFRRYPAAEGNAYVVGGFTASYLRRGDVVLIPVRLGVGLRLGVNAGYMRFSEKNRWLPF